MTDIVLQMPHKNLCFLNFKAGSYKDQSMKLYFYVRGKGGSVLLIQNKY